MFNTGHIIYIAISFLITLGMIILLLRHCATDEGHRKAIKAFAVLTVIIHYSSLWVDFLMQGEVTVDAPMLFPIHPCNVCMWLLLIVAFVKKRETVAFRVVSEFVFWAGTVCGIIGIVFNENYGSNPTLADYGVLKGLLSHSTMIMGAVYLAASKQVRIRVSNTVSVVIGMLLLLVDGLVINGIYALAGLDACNSSFCLKPPSPSYPLSIRLLSVSPHPCCVFSCLCFTRVLFYTSRSGAYSL